MLFLLKDVIKGNGYEGLKKKTFIFQFTMLGERTINRLLPREQLNESFSNLSSGMFLHWTIYPAKIKPNKPFILTADAKTKKTLLINYSLKWVIYKYVLLSEVESCQQDISYVILG